MESCNAPRRSSKKSFGKRVRIGHSRVMSWPRPPHACVGAQESIDFIEQYKKPGDITWDEESYRGDAYGVFSYAAMVVDLEIDKTTYEVTIRDLVTAQDVGRAINPLFVEGQIIGGTAQALGYALLENTVLDDRGVMQNAQFTNYIIPTTLDTPRMNVTIVEVPYAKGPFGAKGGGRASDGRARACGRCRDP